MSHVVAGRDRLVDFDRKQCIIISQGCEINVSLASSVSRHRVTQPTWHVTEMTTFRLFVSSYSTSYRFLIRLLRSYLPRSFILAGAKFQVPEFVTPSLAAVLSSPSMLFDKSIDRKVGFALQVLHSPSSLLGAFLRSDRYAY